MPPTVFYSWQSDLPNSTNRGFLESVLEQAIKKVIADGELAEAKRDERLQLDKDTKDIPGTPPIADAIFDKISSCEIFVPDFSFVGSTDNGRLLPNPNVLIEYGWALSTIGHSRIIPIMNAAYGDVSAETLPFDMRHLRRPITYSLAKDASPKVKANVKRTLVQRVSEAIKLVFEHVEFQVLETDELANRHNPIKPTTSPSTFLQSGEPISVDSYFGSSDHKLYLPENQHLYPSVA